MADANKKKKEQKSATPLYNGKPPQPTSQLPVRRSQTLDRGECPQVSKVTASRSEFESRVWEMEAEMSHEFATMRSELGSQFSELRDDISEIGDSLEDSTDGLKDSVNRYISRLNRHLVLSAIMGLAGLAFLLWQIFG